MGGNLQDCIFGAMTNLQICLDQKEWIYKSILTYCNEFVCILTNCNEFTSIFWSMEGNLQAYFDELQWIYKYFRTSKNQFTRL